MAEEACEGIFFSFSHPRRPTLIAPREIEVRARITPFNRVARSEASRRVNRLSSTGRNFSFTSMDGPGVIYIMEYRVSFRKLCNKATLVREKETQALIGLWIFT